MTHADQTPPRRHSRAGLFTPFVIVMLALVAWTGWWLYLTGQVEGRLETAADQMRRAGWQVTYTDLRSTGWPFRTRVEARHVDIQAPAGHGVAGPTLVAEASAWNPDRWVILAPEGLTLNRAGKGKVAIRAEAIRASVSGLRQPYPNLAVELARPVFTAHPRAEPFPIAGAERIEMYLRPHLTSATADAAGGQVAPAGDTVDVLFRLIEARGRPGGPVEGMAQDGVLTLQAEAVVQKADRLTGADAAGVFSAWTRAGGRFVEVKGEMRAGESRATFSSPVLGADADGRLTGQLAVKAVKPLPALAGMAGSPAAPAGAMGAAAATAAGGRDDIDLTIVFRDGRTFLGPFALAPAPKLF